MRIICYGTVIGGSGFNSHGPLYLKNDKFPKSVAAISGQRSNPLIPLDLLPARADQETVFMADTPLLLREERYHEIKAVLARLRIDSGARVVFLVDKDGQQIAVQGDVGNLDTTSLASLVAGNVAATDGMAQLIGEKEFPTLSHEGEKESIHISVIGRMLLVVVFDERSSLGLVKLRTKQIARQLAILFDEIVRDVCEDVDSPFAEITEEDIDSLFS
jgi:predicted regulator of Ras-like GTPase activity (Roadblock/LC7/MglB family)